MDSRRRSLVFYSTRSGAWNYWWIRADGSDPRQLTAFFDFNGSTSFHPTASRWR